MNLCMALEVLTEFTCIQLGILIQRLFYAVIFKNDYGGRRKFINRQKTKVANFFFYSPPEKNTNYCKATFSDVLESF